MARITIIAEAGVNHNGSLELAKQLVDAAAEAGADYVKFQTFKADKLVTRSAHMAEYQTRNTGSASASQYEMLKKLEISEADHQVLQSYCLNKNIKFLSTGFDIESVDFLDDLGIDLFKIPSGEITNYLYIRHIAGKGKPVIMSTGMCTLEEIKQAFQLLLNEGLNPDLITILHCNTEYPTPFSDVNLLAMNALAKEFKVQVGYSDHTLGIEVPVAAAALGACCIEKHFTLDRTMDGPDHAASLEPNELKAMVTAVRNIELAISGSGIKEPSASELKNIEVARKSLHYAMDVQTGTVLQEYHFTAKRPGNGVSPMELPHIIGKVLLNDQLQDQMFKMDDVAK